MECVITYCNNATDFPISNNLGYEDVDRQNGNPLPLKGFVDIGKHIQYNCISGRRLQNDTDDIGQADASVKVACNETGDYVYPEPWPTCEETVNCTDPGIKYWALSKRWRRIQWSWRLTYSVMSIM